MKLIVFFFVLKLHTLLNIFVFKIQPSKSSNLILHIYEVISHFNKKKKKRLQIHHVSLTGINKFSMYLFV